MSLFRMRSLLVERLEPRVVLSASAQPDLHIVTVRDDVASTAQIASFLAAEHGGRIGQVYEHVLRGFSIIAPRESVVPLHRSPYVSLVEPDAAATLLAHDLPTGVDRVDAELNANVAFNHRDDELWNFRIATIDSGVDIDHADLHVINGRNFVRGANDDRYNDRNGHGTHVAGTIGAIDDGKGVVGVAPGIPIVAARAFDNSGGGSTSDILNAMEWIASTRTDGDPNNDIAIVNMSFTTSSDLVVAAVESLAELGIVGVAASGNHSGSQAMNPARSVYTIGVGAMVDSDGQPGGQGPNTSDGPDDSFAEFSNYGVGVDIASPGVDILSTWKGGGYKTMSGTSMAAPHVAGAVGLFISEFGDAWMNGMPQDEIDVELIRQAIVKTGGARQAAVAMPNGELVSVADASGNWITPPVASFAGPLPTVVSPGDTVSLSIDARDVDTSAEQLQVLLQIDGGPAAGGINLPATYNADVGLYQTTWDTSAWPQGAHRLTAIAMDAQGHASDSQAPIVVNDVTMTLSSSTTSSVFVSDLDGFSSTLKGKSWRASVAVTVVTDDGETVSGATVFGDWIGSATLSRTAVTDADGIARFEVDLKGNANSVIFQVADVDAEFPYDSNMNSDSESDSDGTSIVVSSVASQAWISQHKSSSRLRLDAVFESLMHTVGDDSDSDRLFGALRSLELCLHPGNFDADSTFSRRC